MEMKNDVALKTAFAAAALVTQIAVVGAYTVCDRCGCHINHEGCYWYVHSDICNPGPSGNCYLHIDYACS
jgi:hypothetical protein